MTKSLIYFKSVHINLCSRSVDDFPEQVLIKRKQPG